MLIIKFLLFTFLITLNCCHCQKSPTYRAAVVEVHPAKIRANVKNQLIDIIQSPSLKDVDIIVLPEAILNLIASAVLLPNSTVFCDDPDAHPIFREISCAARKAKMYVVIDVYTKIPCSVDDQSFCVNKGDNTNTYNMAFVFDRNGATIAKYRKFHLWGENVQTPKKPDMVTFHTDFNVTFGVFICFDMLFESPATNLVDKGIRHFVYPTMWPLELPFMNANQFQQSWAYGNDVVLLAANAATQMIIANTINPTSGSGIYAGRSTALDVFFSETPTTKILIANVPIDFQSQSTQSTENDVLVGSAAPMENLPAEFEVDKSDKKRYDEGISQEDMHLYTIEFLDFSKGLSQKGSVCNGGFCCNYDIDVVDNGSDDKKPSYFYAIMAFNGYRGYIPIPKLFTHQSVCGLTACGEMGDRSTCAKRFAIDVNYRYNFKKLSFTMTPPTSRAKNIMANTLSNNLYPLNSKEFEMKTSKLRRARKHTATLTLKTPKSDLLTFAIYSRNYQLDKLTH